MVWKEDGITLEPLDPAAHGEEGGVEQFPFAEGSTWKLERPAALVKNPVAEWPFWRSGTCESVVVHHESSAGTWSAEYNGLTGRGKVVDMEVK
jgi:hypothetical protein